MRLVSYARHDDGLRAGVLIDDLVIDAAACAGSAGLDGGVDWSSVKSIIGRASAEQAQALARAAADGTAEALPRSSIRLGPPVPDPEKVLCIGLNYLDHVEEAKQERDDSGSHTDPIVFSMFSSALIGDRDDVVLPSVAPDWVDWEGELAAVIGSRCRDVSRADALEHVAGYMVFNDISARDVQLASPQWLLGKSFDTAGPCGPALVTADEIGDPQSLDLRTEVNGEVMQSTNTSLMIHSIARVIEHISSLITLVPGDVIATGTPAGVGYARDPKVALRHGDTVTVTISGLGTLTNAVRQAS